MPQPPVKSKVPGDKWDQSLCSLHLELVDFHEEVSNLSTKSTYRPHDLLTKAEAAEEFRVSERYLKWLHDQRRVRSYVIANRVRFRWLDLYDFLESQAKEAAR